MMRVFICAASTIALAGCAAFGGYPQSPVDDEIQLQTLSVYFSPKKYAEYQKAADPALRKAMRNEILFGQVAAYDIKFTQFRIALSQDKLGPDTAADVAVAVMGGVGAATASAATKSGLLAATAAVTGAKGAVDKNLFYDQALSVMFAQMSANRATALLHIEQGSYLADADYPLTRGLIDTAAYRDAGSIPGALTGVATDSGATKDKANSNITALQSAKVANPTVVPAAKRPDTPVTSDPTPN